MTTRCCPSTHVPSWRELIRAGCDAAGNAEAVAQFLRGVRQAMDATHQGVLPLTGTVDDLAERRKLALAWMAEATAQQEPLQDRRA